MGTFSLLPCCTDYPDSTVYGGDWCIQKTKITNYSLGLCLRDICPVKPTVCTVLFCVCCVFMFSRVVCSVRSLAV